METRRSFLGLTLTLAALDFVGCKREEVQVYQAPKDLPARSEPVADERSSPARSEAQSPPWTTPEGWMAIPSTGGMRIASYAIKSADGRTATVSVVPLGPEAAGELDNVNRWRGELGLAPGLESDLGSVRQTVKIGSLDARMYELVSEKPTLDAKFKARTLVSMLATEGTTIFFKLTGEDALVAENKPKYLAWLKSVQVGPPESSPAAGSSAPPGGAAMAGPVAPPPSTGLPTWTPPTSWQMVPGSGMRLATFVVAGPDQSKGDLSVVALGPQAGGLVANVTRWRNQMGLPPMSEAELSAAVRTSTTPAGDSLTLIELEGAGAQSGTNLLAAIVARPDRTWFYKLTAPKALVVSERDRFQKFVQSVKYP